MSQNDYPEHLNPFAEEKPAKRGGGALKLSSSFREFTKTLRKSFRLKKKEKNKEPEPEPVQLRPKVFHSPHTPLSQTQQTRVTFPAAALPRSRFQERLSKSHFNGQPNNDNNNGTLPKNIDVSPTYNPFDGNGEEVKMNIRKRGKKRAPLPPKSISSQNINAESSMYNQSNWSLTSVETDYSRASTDNVSTADTLAETIATMNKEIQKLCDDTNNNKIPQTDDHTVPNVVPDVIISCANDLNTSDNDETDDVIVKDITENLQNPNEEDNSKNETLNNAKCQELEVVNEEVRSDEENKEQVEIEENKRDEIKNEANLLQIKEEEEENEVEKKEIKEQNDNDDEQINKHVEVHLEIQRKPSDEIDDEVEPTPKTIEINGDITNNNNSFVPKDDIPDIDEYLEYNERLSLYIAGSADELNNYNEKNLYIKGSKDNIVNDNETSDVVVPVPKQRKNKLTKDSLLGTNNDNNNDNN